MTELLGVCSYLLLPVIGAGVLRLNAVRKLALDGRIGIATATGALLVAVVMSLMSLLHVRWTATRLFITFGVIALASIVSIVRSRAPQPARRSSVSAAAVGMVASLLIAGYAALGARMTCGDMTFFWAPKAIDFFRNGGIDVGFLRNPDYFLMHSDYPPLLPLVYAWSNTMSHQFAWFAAVFSSVLFLGCTIGVIRSTSRDSNASLLVSVILCYAYAENFLGGCADPLLLLFEAIALVALTFIEPGRSQTVLAAIGLAGAVWTKVEGATFVIAVGLAAIVLRRGFRRVSGMVLPAAVLLSAWIAFASHQRMLDSYGGAQKHLYLAALPTTLMLLARHARFDTLWLPWAALAALIAIGPNRRRALLPLAVGVLDLGAAIYFYLHVPDPTFWIDSSANRTLLPPLLALCVAAVAAHDVTDEDARSPGPVDFPEVGERADKVA